MRRVARRRSARVAQVFTNLLHNAATFTPRAGEMTVHATVDGEEAVVRVCDTGPGIPEDALPRVFDMFVQMDRRDSRADGLGIGLALSRRLVEMHGGRIEVCGRPAGRGAEFVVRLPLAPVPNGAEPQRHGCRHRPGGASRSSSWTTTLNLVEMLAAVVESSGHETARASRRALGRRDRDRGSARPGPARSRPARPRWLRRRSGHPPRPCARRRLPGGVDRLGPGRRPAEDPRCRLQSTRHETRGSRHGPAADRGGRGCPGMNGRRSSAPRGRGDSPAALP